MSHQVTRSAGTGAVVAIVLLTLAGAIAASGAATVLAGGTPRPRAVVPSAPLDVAVVPGVGRLTVSWAPPSNAIGAAVRYTVRSFPAGHACTTSATSCTFHHIDDATPWRFSVDAATASGRGPASARTSRTPHLTVLVVAGQSNAVGNDAYTIDPVTQTDVLASPRIDLAGRRALVVWRESGVPDAGLPPVPLATPQVLVGAPSPVFGPEMGLASRLYADGQHHLLVVKVAFAGTSLAEDWTRSGVLYQTLVQTTRAALAWAAANGWSATVGGVYWLQGETDAEHRPMAAAYGANLTALIGSLRADLALSSKTPFVLGGIDIAKYVAYRRAHHLCRPRACATALEGNKVVRAAERAVAGTLPHTYLVDTAALSRYPDLFIHLTGVAELRLGESFAIASVHHLT